MISSSRLVSAAIAALLATMLAVLSLALTSERASAEPVAITSGHLDWGVKESWRNYIGAAGTTLLDGATRNPDGTFHFPVADGSYDDPTKATVVRFSGGVEFLGHCTGAGGTHVRPCALDMTLRNLRVEITEDHAGIFVDSESRPIEGGEVVTDANVKLVDLDVENVEPTVDAGTTAWSAVPGLVSVEGGRIFTYPLGTPVDPASFAYDGPGGKPAGETWDAPGITDLTATDADTQPDVIPGRIVGALSDGELVGWSPAHGIAVLDADTLEAKSDWVRGVGIVGEIFRDSIAIDPATDTIFAAERTTNVGDRNLLAFEWDGTDLTVTAAVDGYDATLVHDSGSAGAWDAVNDRYLVTRASSVTEHHLWQVKMVDGAWTASKLGRIRPLVAGGSIFENALVNLAVVPNGQGGSVPVATTLFGAGRVVRLTPTAGEFRPEKLREAGDLNADRLMETAHGLYAIAAGDGVAAFLPYEGYADTRRLGEATEPAEFSVSFDSNRSLAQVAVDRATDTLVGVTDSNRSITRLSQGQADYTAWIDGAPWPGSPYGQDGLIGLSPEGAVWSQVGGTLRELTVAGVSPRFTTQPEAPVARLVGESDEIELTAAVTGNPAPELTWQTRIPGLTGWEDLTSTDGAEGDHLTTMVGAADEGRQYRVIAENPYGRVASERVSLALLVPPSITIQPTDVTVAPGATAELKVMPVGNPDPTVQWQQRVNGVWHDVPGATEPMLTFADVDQSLSGAVFRARLSNELGSVLSDRATVTVTVPSTEPISFKGGTVDWGISNRWRCYVTGSVAQGTIELGQGVVKVPGTTPTGSLCTGDNPATGEPWGTGGEGYRFTVAGGSFEPETQKLKVDLRGSVRFLGHRHHSPDGTALLDTEISGLSIEADLATGRGFVQVDAIGSTMENPDPFRFDDIKLVTFDASGLNVEPKNGQVEIEGIETALHEEGAGVITYTPGERFDPLGLTLDVGPREEPGPDPDPDPEPKPTVKPRVKRVGVKRLGARTVVARVACPAASSSACVLKLPRKMRLKARGKVDRKQRRALRGRFAVRAPKRVAPGKVAKIKLVVRPAQRRALRGKQLRGLLRIVSRAPDGPRVAKRIAVRGRVK